MKKFELKQILLLSHRERRARRVDFHPHVTVIKGENHVGKSSLIRSIYHTFGAEPASKSSRWKEAEAKTLVRFELDGIPYALLRSGNSYALFDGQDRILRIFHSVTKELGPYLAELFDVKLLVTTKQDRRSIPAPPACVLLPFYIDQDHGWSSNWASFANLGQFEKWRRDVCEYHTGIHPNEYYAQKANVRDLESQLSRPRARELVLSDIRIKLHQRSDQINLNFDLEAYRADIDILLSQLELLRNKEESYKGKLISLHHQRTVVVAQIQIVRQASLELKRDYQFATDTLLNDEVDCPICGSKYANTFSERLALAQDEDRCVELHATLEADLREINTSIASENRALENTSKEISSINLTLEKKQGDITLRSIIENEGRKEIRGIINEELNAIAEHVGTIENAIKSCNERLKKFDNKGHKSAIGNRYRELMRTFLDELNVLTLSPKSYHRIDSPIKENGSGLPRAVLAYNFSILHLARASSSGTYFPLIIDSPRQQDPDRSNWPRILEFIRTRRPPDTQLVLGLVSDNDVDFGGSVVSLAEKHHLLSLDEYPSVSEELRPYLEGILSARAQADRKEP